MLDVRLRHRQGAFHLDVAFASAAAGVTALFGPSGSGKTSVVRMVAGLARPDAGHVRLDGEPLFDDGAGGGRRVDRPMDKRRIGTVFQEGRLFPHMTVKANLTYGQRLVPPAERRIGFDAVVDLLGIAPLLDRRPAKLSGGEKQRVAVGRALLTSPRLLLMDEPLAALDAPRKQEVLPFIARLPREFAIPILYVTHSMDEILRLADLLVLMRDGRSVAVGAVEDLLNRPDLRPLTGADDTGAVVPARLRDHDARYGLSRLDTAAGPLLVERLDMPPGTEVRARILSRDVSLAAERPIGLSVQNVFRCVVRGVSGDDPGHVEVDLDAGVPLLSRVTRKAAAELGLAEGRTVYALVKAVSIARADLGEHTAA